MSIVKEVDKRNGDLYLVPASNGDPSGFSVELCRDRQTVRVYLSAVEALRTRKGRYPVEIVTLFERTTAVLRRAHVIPGI